jgi:hypothetical protein
MPFMVPHSSSTFFGGVALFVVLTFVVSVWRGWVPAGLGLSFKGDPHGSVLGANFLVAATLCVAAQGIILRINKWNESLLDRHPDCASGDYICHHQEELINVVAYAAFAVVITATFRYVVSA